MAFTFNGSPEKYIDLLYPGLRSIFENSIRSKLKESVDQIVQEAMDNLVKITVDSIESYTSHLDGRVEVKIVMKDRHDRTQS